MHHAVEPGATLRAAITGGKNLILRIPPLPGEAVHVLHRLLDATDGLTVLLCPDHRAAGRLHEIITALEPHSHQVTGLARTARILRSGTLKALVAQPADALALVRMSSLDAGSVGGIVVCWPELMPPELAQSLETFLSDSGGARKALITSLPDAPGELEQRFFWRAASQDALDPPADPPAGRLRYAVISHSPAYTARQILDTMNPETAVFWAPEHLPNPARDFGSDPAVRPENDCEFDPADLIMAIGMARPTVINRLSELSRRLVVLVDPFQLPYLAAVAPAARPIRLASEADAYRDELTALRRRVRSLISAGDYRHYLGVVEPLLDEFDPATIAAAVLDLAVGTGRAEPEPEDTWARLHVNAGRMDNLRTSDLVGALINSAGVQKQDIGRVELKERFSLIEIRPAALDTAIEGLTGLTLKGRLLKARQDRH